MKLMVKSFENQIKTSNVSFLTAECIQVHACITEQNLKILAIELNFSGFHIWDRNNCRCISAKFSATKCNLLWVQSRHPGDVCRHFMTTQHSAYHTGRAGLFLHQTSFLTATRGYGSALTLPISR